MATTSGTVQGKTEKLLSCCYYKAAGLESGYHFVLCGHGAVRQKTSLTFALLKDWAQMDGETPRCSVRGGHEVGI